MSRVKAAVVAGLKTIIDPDWDGYGPTPFIKHHGFMVSAIAMAGILFCLLGMKL